MKAYNHDPASGPNAELERRALAQLRAALQAAGWHLVSPRSKGKQPDLLVQKEGHLLAVALQISPGRSRRDALRGRLADAILESRAIASRLKARPLSVLFAPAISNVFAKELADYIQHVAPDMAWGLMDERGRFELHGKYVEDVLPPEREVSYAPQVAQPVQPSNPFSDLGQWLLKVLLANRIPADLLNAPRQSIQGVAELAAVADVSPASASRFVNALQEQGHLARSAKGLQLVRIEALLHAWRRSAERPFELCYVRALLPGGDPYKQLGQALARRAKQQANQQPGPAPNANNPAHFGPPGRRACLGYFAASQALGLGFVQGAPLHAYCEDLSADTLAELDLAAVENGSEAEWILVRPRFPESVFRGCIEVEGVPVADALQCWLDISYHPARGEEQANEIARRLAFDQWDQ